MNTQKTIPDYIADELAHLSESSKEDADKLAKELNIKTEKLKNKISELLNTQLEILSEKEIYLYYSVYLYLTNQEKRELEQQNKLEKQKRISDIFSQIKEYDKKEYNETHLKELLNSLNIYFLGKVIEHLYYKNKRNTISSEYKRFIVLVNNIDKKIIINIILDRYKNNTNNLFEKLFLKTHSNGGKNKLIEFLEGIDYETYIKFKSLIFIKQTSRITQFYDILKKFIKKIEKKEITIQKSLEEEFKNYYNKEKDIYKGRVPDIRKNRFYNFK